MGAPSSFPCAQHLFLPGPQHRIQPVCVCFFSTTHSFSTPSQIETSPLALTLLPCLPALAWGRAADIALLLQAFLSPRVPWKHAWLCLILRGRERCNVTPKRRSLGPEGQVCRMPHSGEGQMWPEVALPSGLIGQLTTACNSRRSHALFCFLTCMGMAVNMNVSGHTGIHINKRKMHLFIEIKKK